MKGWCERQGEEGGGGGSDEDNYSSNTVYITFMVCIIMYVRIASECSGVQTMLSDRDAHTLH